MNVDVADYDNDGWLDVYVTNITDEYMKECNMLWHNDGEPPAGCTTSCRWAPAGPPSPTSRRRPAPATRCGAGRRSSADFDNDGWLDLFVANGLRSAGPENYIPVLVKMIIRARHRLHRRARAGRRSAT